MGLLVVQGGDGIEGGGLSGRIVAEEDSDRRREQKAPEDRHERDLSRPMSDRGNEKRDHDADRDAGGPAGHAEQYGLDQELQQHLQAPRADRHAYADLAGALGYRDQE